MPTTIDVFEKARTHDRREILDWARENDALPYFRQLESPAMPEVVMEGKPRSILGSNSYLATLPQIATLRQRFGARLMVDEARGLGVLGARGAGACEALGIEDRVDLRMATFSKSLASCGGVIAGPADVIEYLRYYSRPFL